MIYDLNFLKKGAEFPPKSEVKRLDAYRINQMLIEDEAWAALPGYKQRVMYLLSNFDLPDRNVYLFNANYWADLICKMQELTYGEPPEINAKGQENAFRKLFDDTDFILRRNTGINRNVGNLRIQFFIAHCI